MSCMLNLARFTPIEPKTTGLFLFVIALLVLVGVGSSRLAGRLGIPVMLVFLAIGVAAGTRIPFANHELAFRLGTVSLVFILFDGGLNTSMAAMRRAYRPALMLATFGVVITAGLTAAAAHLFGLRGSTALLLGSVASSTDAAAVFSVLRGSRVELHRRVATTIEIESGLNDPMAFILTALLTDFQLGRPLPTWPSTLLSVGYQLFLGIGAGWLFGRAGRFALRRLRLGVTGLLPVFTIALAALAFGLPTLIGGSGLLAVYLCAIVLGDGPLPYRPGLVQVHDALAWLGQVTMFVLLGVLVEHSHLFEIAGMGVGLAFAIALFARPISVLLCLLPFRYPAREVAYVGWVGLRGAVPIIFATYPVLANARDAHRVFDLVFFVVVVSALLQGTTVRFATRALGVEVKAPPPPRAVIEISSTELLDGELLPFYIEEASAVAHARIDELSLPEGASVTLISRGIELIAPRPELTLRPGDHVHVFCRSCDRALIRLLFGRSEGEENGS
jgi:cell volume regulation protein A